jgi:DNA gyrase/topoisomerase IV subunit A
LDALARLHEVNKIVQFSRDRDAAVAALQEEPFRYSRAQADGVLDMPVSWQTSDEAERLRSERDQLLTRRASLHEHVTEVLSLHWFG